MRILRSSRAFISIACSGVMGLDHTLFISTCSTAMRFSDDLGQRDGTNGVAISLWDCAPAHMHEYPCSIGCEAFQHPVACLPEPSHCTSSLRERSAS
jgi:hypothetical protein